MSVKKPRASGKARSAPVKEAATISVRSRERRGLTEAEMNRYLRLEAVEALAGGIAHDFNNALTAIMHNVYAAKMFLDNEARRGDVPELLDACMKTVRRASALTHQLLAFSSGGRPLKKIACLNNVIRDSACFALSGSNIGCEFHISDDLRPAYVDERQVSQALIGLVINARRAMPMGGTIEVRAENVVLKGDDSLPLREGRYIKLSIRNMYPGISGRHSREVFGPGSGTREDGVDLGLADAQSIIKAQGGIIAVESAGGARMAFHVYVPASGAGAEAEPEDVGCFKGGKILVMESEEDIRDSMQSALPLLGYEAEFVGDGAAAVVAYRDAIECGKPFDAVVMDLTVPGGMGGVETLRALKKIDPDVRAVVASGYCNDSVMVDYKRYGFKAAVEKPQSVEDLSRLLRKLIARRGP